MFKLIKILLIFGIGVAIGGFLFSDTQPRKFAAIKDCSEQCFKPSELAGLLVSVGIQKYPASLPTVIKETNKTIVLKHPYSEAPIHYLIIPKKDIKNIAEIAESDREYVIDALAVIRTIVQEQHLSTYQVITNGPGQQQVTYLHFHLMAWPGKSSFLTK